MKKLILSSFLLLGMLVVTTTHATAYSDKNSTKCANSKCTSDKTKKWAKYKCSADKNTKCGEDKCSADKKDKATRKCCSGKCGGGK